MRTNHLVTAAGASLVGVVLTASCVQGPTATPETEAPAVEVRQNAQAGDEAVAEAQEALKVIRCDDGNEVDCMMRCAVAGLVCRPRMEHPNKSDAGKGKLYRCAEAIGEHSCSYLYDNGDRCVLISGRTWLPCLYLGGQ